LHELLGMIFIHNDTLYPFHQFFHKHNVWISSIYMYVTWHYFYQ